MRSERASIVVYTLVFMSVASLLDAHKYPLADRVKGPLGHPKALVLNFTESTSRYGYKPEVHTVETEDGYLLTLFRMGTAREREKARGPPALIVHGLLQSADSWIEAGPTAGLGYLLPEAGHDLWLGNVRGNYYSRAHTRLSPKDAAFWDFSMDEIGRFDIPAMLDYVLRHTGANKLNYIGFSQGAGAYFIMCSERREYCDRAQLLIALSPATRHIYTRSSLFRVVTESFQELSTVLRSNGINEVLTRGSLTQKSLEILCQFPEILIICTMLKEMLDSVLQINTGSVTNETIKNLVGHFPGGTSVKNMARFGQAMNSDRFVKFDYGTEKNLKLYGSVRPPEYKLSAVTVPVVAIYGRNDGIVDSKDVEWVLKKLPNVVGDYVVKDPHWSHLDMTFSQYIKQLAFPKINEYLLKYNYK